MCTTICHSTPASGSAKGAGGWFRIDEVTVGYDHPFHAPLEHAVSIDFTSIGAGGAIGAGASHRVAVELERSAARALLTLLRAALDEADAYEGAEA